MILSSSHIKLRDHPLESTFANGYREMTFLGAVVLLLCVIVREIGGSAIKSSTTADIALNTPPPDLLNAHGVQEKQQARNPCGHHHKWGTITREDTSAYCKGTILSNHEAFAYCSTEGAADQFVEISGQFVAMTCRMFRMLPVGRCQLEHT